MIVVTGATGNVGLPLVLALAAAGEQVTAVSRGLSNVDLPADVQYRRADLAEPSTLEPAFDGADALFLLAAGDSPDDILDVAKAGGIRRVVLLSSQGAGTRPEIFRQPRAFEDAVRQSGLDWTVLRPSGFDSNTYAWAETVRSRREVSAPFGDIALPFVDPVDVAGVAAAALREGSHSGHTYELTGPIPITPKERARALGDALGTPVRFVEQSPDEARAHMLQFMPEPAVAATLAILGRPSAAEQRVSPAVEQVLGRPPATFAQWAARNVAAFS